MPDIHPDLDVSGCSAVAVLYRRLLEYLDDADRARIERWAAKNGLSKDAVYFKAVGSPRDALMNLFWGKRIKMLGSVSEVARVEGSLPARWVDPEEWRMSKV